MIAAARIGRPAESRVQPRGEQGPASCVSGKLLIRRDLGPVKAPLNRQVFFHQPHER